MTAHCNPPACRRAPGHKGACRETFHDRPVCGRVMPQWGDICGRTAGHANACRSRFAMDNELGIRPAPKPWRSDLAVILGPVPCMGCRTPVVYARSENAVRDHLPPILRNFDGRRHVCRVAA